MKREKVDDCGCSLTRTENGLHMKDCSLHGAAPDLLEACREWMKYDSEHFKNTPCPDPILRENYRLRAIKLTKEAIAKAESIEPAQV